MGLGRFDGRIPEIGERSYIHPSADVFGDVVVGRGCWIGPGARIRGDYGTIRIGDFTSIEDNCVIHARPGEVCTIGNWVTIGHGAIIHNALSVDDWAVIGMGAIVSDWARIGVWAVVGEGAVVKQRQEIPDGRIAIGVPAHILEKVVANAYKAEWTRFKERYVELAGRYPAGWSAI
jgi:phenylacetic acid degradation protein